MTSVLLFNAATCRAVHWSSPVRLSTSAPLCNKIRVTSVLLLRAAHLSAVIPNSNLALSTGTQASSSLFTKLTSPSRAALWKRYMSCLSISTRELQITIKQFDVSETHVMAHSNQSCNFFQILVQVTTKSFQVDVKLPAQNNLRLCLEIKVHNNQLWQ